MIGKKIVIGMANGDKHTCTCKYEKGVVMNFNISHNVDFETECLIVFFNSLIPEIKKIGMNNIKSINFVEA